MNNQKFKGVELTQTKTVNNILKYYNLSTDLQKSNGLKWYKEAYNFCLGISNKTGLEVYRIIGVLAALSPQCSWDRNKEITYLFCVNKIDTGLHTSQQINKAYASLSANNPDEIFNLLTKEGIKTSCFYWNILLHGMNTGKATIDRHAIGISIQDPTNTAPLTDSLQMTKKQYDFFVTCYCKAAKKVNLLPQDLQAITWLTYRELRELPIDKDPVIIAPF